MNFKKESLIKFCGIFFILIIGLTTWVYSQTSYIMPGVQSEYDYIVYKEASTYYAKNDYGLIEYSGSNISFISNNIMGYSTFYKIAIYYFDSPIFLKNNTKIIGEDRFKTIFYLSDSSNCHLIQTPYPSYFTENLTISTLTLNGNYQNQGAFDSRALSLYSVNNTIIENIEILQSRNDAIRLTNTTLGKNCHHVRIKDFHIKDCNPSAGEEVIDTTSWPQATYPATDIIISNGLIENCRYGINLGDAQYSKVEMVTIINSGNNFEIEGNTLAHTITFKNCYSINAKADTSFYTGVNNPYVTFENCYSLNSLSPPGFSLQSKYCKAINCYAINASTNHGFIIGSQYNILSNNHAINNGNGGDYGYYLYSTATNNTFIGNIAIGNFTIGMTQIRGFKEDSGADFNIFIGNISEKHPYNDDLVGPNDIKEHNFMQGV